MTQRERQLLEWIRENPMISQQELADKAGITRSSTAVHISNLMKKGYIAGRGYLLRTAPYIVVIGGVNMDIGAVSRGELVSRDSNPGRVVTSLGGVGRNIAHNLCLLGEEVSMVTVLGQDSFAQSVRENATAIGLDLTHSAVIPGGRTGTYLFIAGPDGDMELAVNDMDIYEHITPEFLRQRMDFINHADLVVTETNLPAASLQWLCQHCAAPILADPVSTIKAPKRRRPTRPTRRKSCSRRACSRSTSPSARRGSMPPTAAATRRSSPARTSTSRTPPAAVTPRRRRWPPALCAADRSRRRRGSPWARARSPAHRRKPSTPA